MGINLGDVIAEEHDIFGDGVNVAARLEALAEPGGICISRVVRDQIRDKLPYPFEDMGEQSVKNIARPVRVYAWRPEAIAGPPTARVPPATSSSPPIAAPRLSIVVLPFANLSDDRERHHRRFDDRSVADRGDVRDLAQHCLHLSEQDGHREADRPRVGGMLRPARKRPPVGQPGPRCWVLQVARFEARWKLATLAQSRFLTEPPIASPDHISEQPARLQLEVPADLEKPMATACGWDHEFEIPFAPAESLERT